MINTETSIEVRNTTPIEEQKAGVLTDIEYEIECPRCHDTMTLQSDFDSLYYFCEECGFILYTIRKSL